MIATGDCSVFVTGRARATSMRGAAAKGRSLSYKKIWNVRVSRTRCGRLEEERESRRRALRRKGVQEPGGVNSGRRTMAAPRAAATTLLSSSLTAAGAAGGVNLWRAKVARQSLSASDCLLAVPQWRRRTCLACCSSLVHCLLRRLGGRRRDLNACHSLKVCCFCSCRRRRRGVVITIGRWWRWWRWRESGSCERCGGRRVAIWV